MSARDSTGVPGSGSARRSSGRVRAWSASGTPQAAPTQSMTLTRSAATSTLPGEKDLQLRRERAQAEGWLGEIEGIDLTLRFLSDKQQQAERLQKITGTVALGMPSLRPPGVPRGRT
jgi:hypothetical protein